MDDNEIKWRFPRNDYGQETGSSNSDFEAFRGDALGGLAREVVQNSIDAGLSDDACVKVEFSCFDVERNMIPGIDDIQKQIEAGIETWANLGGDTKSDLDSMLKCIKQETIHCCRISDFNTTGLSGVFDESDQNSSWHNLVKGSGISNKTSNSGGSKGVGKNAAFANSGFRTVFYSTKTSENEEGYIGIAKLCSARIDDTSGEMTQGTGYYGSSRKNTAIPGQLQLDHNFTRSSTGTDVYIIGFSQKNNWERDVIVKLLDSFMVAIVFGKLELKVGDYQITKDTLSEYVKNEHIVSSENKEGRAVISQYLLLTESDPHMIDVEGVGTAALYFLNCYDKNKEYNTECSCIMVRYPYMKIRTVKTGFTKDYAAMCVINNSKLSGWLKGIENPQHLDWEFKRLDSNPGWQKELKRLYGNLMEQIKEYIRSHRNTSDNDRVNLEGAEEFIPQQDNSENPDASAETPSASEKQKLNSRPTLSSKKIKMKTFDIDAHVPDPAGNGVELDIGSLEGEDEDIVVPEGHNNGENGNIKPGHVVDRGTSSGDDSIVVKPTGLRSMKYRFVCLNKKEGHFGIIFNSDYDEPDATFEVYEVDENGNTEKLIIHDATVNNEHTTVDNQADIHVSLIQNKRTVVEFHTNRHELFSAEVKAYASR